MVYRIGMILAVAAYVAAPQLGLSQSTQAAGQVYQLKATPRTVAWG